LDLLDASNKIGSLDFINEDNQVFIQPTQAGYNFSCKVYAHQLIRSYLQYYNSS